MRDIKIRKARRLGGVLVLAHFSGKDAADTLAGHGPIGKAKGFGGVFVSFEQVQAITDARQGRAAGLQRRTSRLIVGRQVRFERVEARFFAKDPLFVGSQQRRKSGLEPFPSELRENLHVEFDPLKKWGIHLFDFINRQNAGADLNSAIPCRVSGPGTSTPEYHGGRLGRGFVRGKFRVHAYTVPNGKFNLAAIGHFHCLGFKLLVGLGNIERAFEKNRRMIWRAHNQFGLEDPGFIFTLLWFRLAIDQEKRYRPGTVVATHQTADIDIREVRFRVPGRHLAVF